MGPFNSSTSMLLFYMFYFVSVPSLVHQKRYSRGGDRHACQGILETGDYVFIPCAAPPRLDEQSRDGCPIVDIKSRIPGVSLTTSLTGINRLRSKETYRRFLHLIRVSVTLNPKP